MANFKFSDKAQQINEFIQQTNSRTALRIIKQAIDSDIISGRDAVMLCTPPLLDGILFASVDSSQIIDLDIILRHSGMPGAATGKVARTIQEAEDYIKSNTSFILVLPETKPEYIRYIESAVGVVTFEGGITSHAAIITRQKGKPAIIGCGKADLNSGEEITIDGTAGIIVRGKVPINPPRPDNDDLAEILKIADGLASAKTHHIIVKANADTPKDAAKARKLGAKGIGVVRTEHMFFAEDRLPHMQAMIMAADESERRQHLAQLLTMQQSDFSGILEVMDGLPVTIRLLDAPLHEFMPHDADDVSTLADKLQITDTEVEQRIADLHEANPMLGKRAVRLGIIYPEIYETQVRAILQAASELEAAGKQPNAQIMIPLISEVGEVEFVKGIISKVAAEIADSKGKCPKYKVGIMTEIPSTCLNAAEFAKQADFFSFGTNDLTQTTLGISRDDTGDITAKYLQAGIYQTDPFQTIHPQVARLMALGIAEGKQANPGLDVSVCGEHGGDPDSIRICQRIGVNAVSVSPPRISVARLVAAQAMLEHEIVVSSWQARQTASSRTL